VRRRPIPVLIRTVGSRKTPSQEAPEAVSSAALAGLGVDGDSAADVAQKAVPSPDSGSSYGGDTPAIPSWAASQTHPVPR
jgi:hypothetical protein